MSGDLGRTAAETFVHRLEEALPGRLQGAWLFGSVARGEAGEDSDLDVLVLVDRREPALLRVVYGVADDVSRESGFDISAKVVPVPYFESHRGEAFFRNVTSEGIALA